MNALISRINNQCIQRYATLNAANHIPRNAKASPYIISAVQMYKLANLENTRPRHNIMKLLQSNARTNTGAPIRLLYHILE